MLNPSCSINFGFDSRVVSIKNNGIGVLFQRLLQYMTTPVRSKEKLQKMTVYVKEHKNDKS